jgi:hypothetical protein
MDEEWDGVLRELADDPSDYIRDGATALLTRRGTEQILELTVVPSAGLSVRRRSQDVAEKADVDFIPISTYVQRELLGLPRLAKQLQKALSRTVASRPVDYIEGPAQFLVGRLDERRTDTSSQLRRIMSEAIPGSTRLIQLMAAAGQGKTVLLEHLAVELAKGYQPHPFPQPLLLPVDLLGRYVGTIDDAIAGSLNNTYSFPLSQREVALCVRRRWLILALDAFDELVARVGARDAFLRISELLEQLEGSGTVLVSARESFFELYQVTAAIRSYLIPRSGSYDTAVVRLLPWTEREGAEVFTRVGSRDPERDLGQLMLAFDRDDEIVLHPFFLTRLATLWHGGERFTGAASLESDRLTRTKFIIETFVQRESQEKWVGRDGKPLLDMDGHTAMLGAIAEEMWRSGAFRLSKDELSLAATIGLTESGVERTVIEAAVERVPTHAAILARDRWYAFLHERFLNYFLGHRLATLLARSDGYPIQQILLARDIAPNIAEWLRWRWSRTGTSTETVVDFLNSIAGKSSDGVLRGNLGLVCASLLRGYQPKRRLTLSSQLFFGEALKGGFYESIRFENCEFWNVDLSDTALVKCEFIDCDFGDVRVSQKTRFQESDFTESRFVRIEQEDGSAVYAPQDVETVLERMGAKRRAVSAPSVAVSKARAVSEELRQGVERLVKASIRTCDVAVEEMEERYGKSVKKIVGAGLKVGVLRQVEKDTRGPKKTFVRFQVDKPRLLSGQAGPTGERMIDEFWKELER